MAVPRYIFEIISYLDDDEDNLPQIIEKFKKELQEDGKLNAFESYVNIMTWREVAGFLRIGYNIPEQVKIEEPSEDEKPTQSDFNNHDFSKKEKILAARRERYRKSKQILDQQPYQQKSVKNFYKPLQYSTETLYRLQYPIEKQKRYQVQSQDKHNTNQLHSLYEQNQGDLGNHIIGLFQKFADEGGKRKGLKLLNTMGKIILFEPDFSDNYDLDFESQISLEPGTEKSLIQTNQESRNTKTRAKWSKAEDLLLQRYTKLYGRDWWKISMFIHSKTPELIEKRWILKYDPSLKHTKWTRQEDDQILRLYSKYGGKWIKISREIPNRHCDAIKNRYYSVLRIRMLKDQPRPLSPPWEEATTINEQSTNDTQITPVASADSTEAHESEIPDQQDFENPIKYECVGLNTSYPIEMTKGVSPISKLRKEAAQLEKPQENGARIIL